MTQNWEPGTQYNNGDVVRYNGHQYKIIQPHRSQGDWTPDVTPALWGRMQDGGGGGHHDGGGHHNSGGNHDNQHHEQATPAPPAYNQSHQGQGQAPPSTTVIGQGDHKVEVTEEKKKKHWWDLEEDDRKKLEVGGGLLAGVAVLGAGYFAYNEHKKSDEDKKAQQWALSNWARDAEGRRADFDRNGLRGPAQWVLNRGKSIPPRAILVSREKDWNLYIARAFYEGGIHPGKASEAFKQGAVIGYDNDEIHFDSYEILVGDMNHLIWVDTSGPLRLQNLQHRPVEGGREEDGTLIYIAAAFHSDTEHPGKCSEKMKGAVIPYGGKEKTINQYRVLCYK